MVGHIIRTSQVHRPQELIIINNNELRRSMFSETILDVTQPCIPFFPPFFSSFLSPSHPPLVLPSYLPYSFSFFLLSFLYFFFPSPLSISFLISCLSPTTGIISPLSSYHILKTMLFMKSSLNFRVNDIMPVS